MPRPFDRLRPLARHQPPPQPSGPEPVSSIEIVGQEEALEVREFAYDGARVRRIVRALIWSEYPGSALIDGVALDVTPEAVDEASDWPLRWRFSALPPPGRVQFSIPTVYSDFRFVLDQIVPISDGVFGCKYPVMVERRRVRVDPLTPLETSAVVECINPKRPEIQMRLPAHAFDPEGLDLDPSSYRDQLDARSLLIGTVRGGPLDGVEICGHFRFAGFDADGAIRGRWTPETGEEARRWQGVVSDLRHPRTAIRGPEPALSWDLFRRCGYFNLSGKSEADFLAVRRAHDRVVRLYGDHPKVGVHAVWTHGDRVAGTLAAARMTRRSWFGLHLAKDPGAIGDTPGPHVLQSLHRRVYEHICEQPEAGWMVGLFQRTKTWSAYAHAHFPDRYLASGLADALGVHVWELEARPNSSPLSPLRDDELEEAAAEVSTQHTSAFVDAFGLNGDDLHLDSTNALYAKAGLTRTRQCFAVREAGRLAAVALAEWTSKGVHVYGLMNAVWLYDLSGAGTQYFGRLLATVSNWFYERGEEKFMLIQPLTSRFLPRLAEPLAAADLTLVSTSILPDLAEHIWEITARARKV